jgi:hypothetical protein
MATPCHTPLLNKLTKCKRIEKTKIVKTTSTSRIIQERKAHIIIHHWVCLLPNVENRLLGTGMSVWQGVAMDSLKFHPGPPMPYPSTPCGEATPETALQPFQGWPTHRAGSLHPSSTPLDTPRRTPKGTSLESDFGRFSIEGDRRT